MSHLIVTPRTPALLPPARRYAGLIRDNRLVAIVASPEEAERIAQTERERDLWRATALRQPKQPLLYWIRGHISAGWWAAWCSSERTLYISLGRTTLHFRWQ